MTIDISIHTDVFCDDGLVGKSTHIVVDLVTEQVTHIVVKMKESMREYLVPLEKITSSDQEEIQLNCSKDEVGEVWDPTPVSAKVLPGAMRVLVPGGGNLKN
jgi:diacylglycerol kinase family enzyme